MTQSLPLEERLTQLLTHLGIERAHWAACMPRDWQGLVAKQPESIASLTLLCPMGINVGLLSSESLPVLCISGDKGRSAQETQRAAKDVPQAKIVTLRDYFSPSWADAAKDRGEEVDRAISEFIIGLHAKLQPASLTKGSGEFAEIVYSIHGKGQPLVLMPLALSPSQWDPLIARLGDEFCTITLSGPHLGMVAHLEARAQSGYMRVIDTLIAEIGLAPGQSILEIGCGPGAIVRRLAKKTAGQNRIVGADVNRYLMREAAALAKRDGVAQWIEFQEGNAEKLPFADNSYDVAMACTVMEEGDADRMIAELTRVTKPGGRVANVVRSIDMPRWVNLQLSAALKYKVEAPGLVGGNVNAEGCADMSLYRRMHAAGLCNIAKMPQWASHHGGERLQYMQDRIAGVLSADELVEWRAAIAQAQAEGSFFMTEPFHCAVGKKAS
ncbi:MAG: methyltransferase domain-containing protein [Deltaproteobacteria bacterium]|nr:methyltransferase domain-containing protein [Deltaproteobacteria bacterium]